MGTIREHNGKNGISYTTIVRLRGYPVQIATFTEAKEWIQKN